MKIVDNILHKLEFCLQNLTYEPVETERLELKPTPSHHDDWTEIYKTICAFLNTTGGILIFGVKEDQKNRRYVIGAGFTESIESKIKDIARQFTAQDGQLLAVETYLNLTAFQIRPLLDKQVGVMYIERLPDEMKYAHYKGSAYERQLTGDHKIIDKKKILAHHELKQELAAARELMPVTNATLADLDVDKLNEFIQLLNREVKIETIKPDILAALPFLTRKGFVREQTPTVLGMLVCGSHNECLANKIDLPYYRFHAADDISLFIPKGRLVDDEMKALFERFSGFIERQLNGDQLTDEQKLVLAYFYKSELENLRSRYTILLTADNNHFNSIINLERAGLLTKHELSGLFPVYLVHRTLMTQKFTSELRQLLGGHYDTLSNDSKEVLDVIYQYGQFSKVKTVSANFVGNFLYFRQFKTVTDVRHYDGFKRKIRRF